jgi:hypothetical protein
MWWMNILMLLSDRNKQPPKFLRVKLKLIVKKVLPTVIETTNCGFFDGACHTLAHAIHSYFDGTEIYHISRRAHQPDHSVVYFPSLDMYYDADGFQTNAELFKKMRTVEMVFCNELLPFKDFNATELVFPEAQNTIKQLLLKSDLIYSS